MCSMIGLLKLTIILVLALTSYFTLATEQETGLKPRSKSWFGALKDRLFGFLPGRPKQTPESSLSPPPAHSEPAMDTATTTTNVELSDDEVKRLLGEALAVIETNVEAAADRLIQVLQARPDHPEANGHMGAILLGLNQLDPAESMLFRAIIGSQWRDVTSALNLARLFRLRNDFDLAVPALIKVANTTLEDAIDPNLRYRLDNEIVDLMLTVRNYSLAAEWALSAAQRFSQPSLYAAIGDSNWTSLWVHASTIYFPPEHQNLEVAAGVLLRAFQIHQQLHPDPDTRHPGLLFPLGLTMYSMNRVEESIVFYEAALRRYEGQRDQSQIGQTVAALATSYHSLSRANEAEYYYRRAVEILPRHVVLLANFARLLYPLPGRQEEALRILETAANIDLSAAAVQQALRELNIRVIQEEAAPAASTQAAGVDNAGEVTTPSRINTAGA